MKQSGVYYLQIRGTAYWYLKVFCEQEIADGGWTVSFDIYMYIHTLKHLNARTYVRELIRKGQLL